MIEAGTVSHGTMRPEDLVPTFLSVLAEHDEAKAEQIKLDYASVIAHLETGLEPPTDTLSWLMEALFDALDDIAPAGLHFGAHEGDGSDYGFWPNEEDE